MTVSNVDFYRPQWYWNTSIDYDGFRYQLNSERGAWTDVARGYYQPVANLEPGTYTLYVQACDSAGNWSLSGSATIDLPVRVRISDVTIESEVLRKVIESQGLTYVDEVKSIQYRNDSGFADIRGIRHFTNLAEVDFSGSPELADISELEYLTGLERLNLGDCNVTELGAIAGLDSLRYLFLSHNTELADLEPLLLGLPNLEELYLQYTEFTDKDIEEIAAAHPDCVVVSAPD